MSDKQTNSQELYDQMRREHEELREILGKVGRTLAKRMETVANVADMLTSLVEQVETHFAEEEFEGFFDEVEEQAPRYSERTEALRDEHDRLREAIRSVEELAGQGDGSDDWWQRLESGFRAFSTDLMHHESKEHELLQDAYAEDIGLQD